VPRRPRNNTGSELDVDGGGGGLIA